LLPESGVPVSERSIPGSEWNDAGSENDDPGSHCRSASGGFGSKTTFFASEPPQNAVF
jgi:hypothetical protein